MNTRPALSVTHTDRIRKPDTVLIVAAGLDVDERRLVKSPWSKLELGCEHSRADDALDGLLRQPSNDDGNARILTGHVLDVDVPEGGRGV